MDSEVKLSIANLASWQKYSLTVVRIRRYIKPALCFNVSGLDPKKEYTASIMMHRVDDCVYQYKEGKWCKWSKTEKDDHIQMVYHTDGLKNGEEWMKSSIDFSWLHTDTKPPVKHVSKTFIFDLNHVYQPTVLLSDGIEVFSLWDPTQKFLVVSNNLKKTKNRSGIETVGEVVTNRLTPSLQMYTPLTIDTGNEEEYWRQMSQGTPLLCLKSDLTNQQSADLPVSSLQTELDEFLCPSSPIYLDLNDDFPLQRSPEYESFDLQRCATPDSRNGEEEQVDGNLGDSEDFARWDPHAFD